MRTVRCRWRRVVIRTSVAGTVDKERALPARTLSAQLRHEFKIADEPAESPWPSKRRRNLALQGGFGVVRGTTSRLRYDPGKRTRRRHVVVLTTTAEGGTDDGEQRCKKHGPPGETGQNGGHRRSDLRIPHAGIERTRTSLPHLDLRTRFMVSHA